jgi:formate-dependent nitrite reductase cytochrome c552 subunit
MKQVTESQWTAQEREIAQTALANAHKREVEAIIQIVRERANEVRSIDEVWQLNDFLSARRFDIDGKYDDREEEILFVLAKLTKDGWLQAQDVEGLEAEKRSKITALARIL